LEKIKTHLINGKSASFTSVSPTPPAASTPAKEASPVAPSPIVKGKDELLGVLPNKEEAIVNQTVNRLVAAAGNIIGQ